jgi:hypothetical protein
MAATVVPRKWVFFPIESTRRAAAGRAIAIGRPGYPPPEPRSRRRVVPRARRSGSAASESATWSRTAADGSRMAVRLTDPVQASRSRRWPSIAARSGPSGSSPAAATTPASAVAVSAGRGAVAPTSVGSGSRRSVGRPSSGRLDRLARRSRRRSVRSGGVPSVWRPSVGFAAGSPRTPRERRAPIHHGADGGRYERRVVESTGLSTNPRRRRTFVDNRAGAHARATGTVDERTANGRPAGPRSISRRAPAGPAGPWSGGRRP